MFGNCFLAYYVKESGGYAQKNYINQKFWVHLIRVMVCGLCEIKAEIYRGSNISLAGCETRLKIEARCGIREILNAG